jgi:putative membrane protein
MTNDTDKPSHSLDPRTYFAAERTLLAWVRTGLAMMGFGFVVARFGLFLRELAAVRNDQPPHAPGLSLWAGTTLVVLGVVVDVAAVVQHWRTVRRLERGQPLHFRFWSLGIVVGLALGLFGLLIAGYLILGVGR